MKISEDFLRDFFGLKKGEKVTMKTLDNFNDGVKTITQGGMHDYTEAISRTPKGFVLIKIYRSLDFYHWSAEYMKIEEWKTKGGVYSADGCSPK